METKKEVAEKSPATLFIPKGVRPKSAVISGKGMFICGTLQEKYSATL